MSSQGVDAGRGAKAVNPRPSEKGDDGLEPAVIWRDRGRGPQQPRAARHKMPASAPRPRRVSASAGAAGVAVVQGDVELGRTDRNLRRAKALVADAAARGAAIVIFPEMYLTGYEIWPELGALSLRPSAPVLRAMGELARQHRTGIVVGFPERRPDGVYNTVSVLGPDGRVAAFYRKIHLFGRERDCFRSGREYRLVRVAGLTLGLLICYDLEFPEAARVLALGGADIIAVSSANMEPFRRMQDVYVRARALENQVFVALANRVGTERGVRFVGGSGIWDPTGMPVVEAGEEEGVLIGRVEARRIAKARTAYDYLADRRPETYGRLAARVRGARRPEPRVLS
jgi:5-aminopentanamidase